MEHGRMRALVLHGGLCFRYRPGSSLPICSRPSQDVAFERSSYVLVAPHSQITHIQFLTLLYPSALEARLIFSLLGAPTFLFLFPRGLFVVIR
jgi:hypothetical protein